MHGREGPPGDGDQPVFTRGGVGEEAGEGDQGRGSLSLHLEEPSPSSLCSRLPFSFQDQVQTL